MMPISKYLASLSVGACFVSTVYAGTEMTTKTTSTEPPPAETPMPTFRVEDVAPRKSPSGLNVALFGGVTLAQGENASQDINPSFGPGLPDLSYHPGDSVGGLGGIKVGYTWDPALNPNYVDEGWVKLMPAVEVEAFYLGWSPSGNVNTSNLVPPGTTASAKSDIDSGVFSVNGIMKFEIAHIVRPYVGFGIGGAYMAASKSSMTINPGGGGAPFTLNGGNANDFVLAAQAIGGIEVTLTNNWTLFGEYKFLYLNDPNFNYGSYKENYDYIDHQIVSAGVRYYFY